MPTRVALLLLALVAGCLVRPGTAIAAPVGATCDQRFCVGAASVDMSWHVGAGQGQLGGEGNGVTSDKFDPFHHQTKMVPTDGIQARSYAKAIVIQGADGTKVAYVKSELYLQQDVLTRRVVQLVSGEDPMVDAYTVEGLDGAHIMIGATHNHSAPHYSSTAAGVWAFADAFDFRMFEATARRIALAVKQADERLTPARMGASVSRFGAVQRNIIGPGVADDGSPAGFPFDYLHDDLSVLRFDAVPSGRPIAALVNFGMHPESTDGVDLISADYVGMVERMTERAMGKNPGSPGGPVVAWSQANIGDVEPDEGGRAHPYPLAREFWRKNFAQAELMSRMISATVLDTWRDVIRRTPEFPSKFIPLSGNVPVSMVDYRFAGPPGHPIPTVSNCRTAKPGVPVVGLPDCERPPEDMPEEFGESINTLQEAGIPIPDNYGAPGYTTVQEELRIHLQAMRLGEVVLATCPCEPISDMVKNFRSRSDRFADNQYAGFLWRCAERGGKSQCNFQTSGHAAPDWRDVDPAAIELMKAQVTNDATGWEEDQAHLGGEVEAEPSGNFSFEELVPDMGYRLPLMVGQSNDYIGYVVTYREYMRGDHYRKALTPFGPHTSDYINTRLVRMAGELKGGPGIEDGILDQVFGPVDELLQMVKTVVTGTAGSVVTTTYESAIPDDGGEPGVIDTPPSPEIERFRAATMTWQGGSNWTDNPYVTVQRKIGRDWETFATQEGGEVVVTLAYDSYASDAPLLWLTGGKEYHWTAVFEAFERTPPGSYRFRVHGLHRAGREPVPYDFESAAFKVSPWSGISIGSLKVDRATSTATFTTAGVEATIPEAELETDGDAELAPNEIHYPDTYEAELPFLAPDISIEENDPHRYCFRCTFRAWADSGRIRSAIVTVQHASGGASTFPAHLERGRWVAKGLALSQGDVVFIAARGIRDEFGNFNGRASARVRV